MCVNKSSFSAENLQKHEISTKLGCARTKRTLRTSFKLIIWFIESCILLHFTLIKILGSGQNNGPFRIGGFFSHPVYYFLFHIYRQLEILLCLRGCFCFYIEKIRSELCQSRNVCPQHPGDSASSYCSITVLKIKPRGAPICCSISSSLGVQTNTFRLNGSLPCRHASVMSLYQT